MCDRLRIAAPTRARRRVHVLSREPEQNVRLAPLRPPVTEISAGRKVATVREPDRGQDARVEWVRELRLEKSRINAFDDAAPPLTRRIASASRSA